MDHEKHVAMDHDKYAVPNMDNEKYPTNISPNEKQVVRPEIPIYNDLERVQDNEISIGSILKGTSATPMTLFEKKAALINAEMDKFGMGKYQWCIWFLTGFGYFLDLAWAQGVGLIASAVYQEMNVPSTSQGNIWSCANAGLAVGAFGWGILVDIVGRKWAFNLTCLITSVFGLLLAAPVNNYGAVCGIYFLACLGLGGNIPIDATIALEFLPQSRRNLVTLLSLWQPVGVVVASLIAWGTAAKYRCNVKLPACSAVAKGAACCTRSSNMGWRYEIIILGLMTLAIFFLRFFVFRFYESPKFLLSKGREAEAIEVLHKIAKYNKAAPPTLTVDMFRAVEESESHMSAVPPAASGKHVVKSFFGSFKHMKGLFTDRLQLFIFVLLGIAYMGDYWSFNLAGEYLPIILLQNNVESSVSVSQTYKDYVYIYLPGIIGAFMGLFTVSMPLVGRKWSLVFSAVCQGLAMAMYTQVKSQAGYVGLNALEYLMQTFFNAVLYASAPELFKTAYRGSASGMLSCLGRLAGIVAPFVGAHYVTQNNAAVLWFAAGGIWVSALTMVFLPVEMRGRQMF